MVDYEEDFGAEYKEKNDGDAEISLFEPCIDEKASEMVELCKCPCPGPPCPAGAPECGCPDNPPPPGEH